MVDGQNYGLVVGPQYMAPYIGRRTGAVTGESGSVSDSSGTFPAVAVLLHVLFTPTRFIGHVVFVLQLFCQRCSASQLHHP